jgi:hypothetical protein
MAQPLTGQAFAAGLHRLEVALRQAALPEGVALRAAALELERATVLELSQPGSGRAYRRGNVVHVASAPGEPPAPDTGVLRASVHSGVIDGEMRVGVRARYAAALEFGTATAGKSGHVTIAPRPFMRPALAKALDRMRLVVRAALDRAAEQA